MLVFYPGDNTPVCTRQLNAYTDDIDAFDERRRAGAGHQPAVGREPRASSPCKQGGFAFPLLADDGQGGGRGLRHRSARSASTGGRCSSIDGDGLVRYAHRALAGLTFRPTDELVAAVEAAG